MGAWRKWFMESVERISHLWKQGKTNTPKGWRTRTVCWLFVIVVVVFVIPNVWHPSVHFVTTKLRQRRPLPSNSTLGCAATFWLAYGQSLCRKHLIAQAINYVSFISLVWLSQKRKEAGDNDATQTFVCEREHARLVPRISRGLILGRWSYKLANIPDWQWHANKNEWW